MAIVVAACGILGGGVYAALPAATFTYSFIALRRHGWKKRAPVGWFLPAYSLVVIVLAASAGTHEGDHSQASRRGHTSPRNETIAPKQMRPIVKDYDAGLTERLPAMDDLHQNLEYAEEERSQTQTDSSVSPTPRIPPIGADAEVDDRPVSPMPADAGLFEPPPRSEEDDAIKKIKRYHISVVREDESGQSEKLDNLWIIRVDPKDKNRQWVGKRARRRLTDFLRDTKSGKSKRVPERLLWHMYLIGQRFDSTIVVVSGYEHKSPGSDRHKQGRAIDFRVEGVSSRDVWNYCKRFDNVGLGLYVKHDYVHLDVRNDGNYWLSESRGERPSDQSK